MPSPSQPSRSSRAGARAALAAPWLLLAMLASGCITVAGDRLADLEPAPPQPPTAPHLEQTVGDFTFHLDGGKMVTSNKMGRILQDEILARWQKAGFIAGHSYVKSGDWSGRAEYQLTLAGHQEGRSSAGMQFLSGLTLFVIPYWVTTDMDVRYTLEHVPSGRTFEAEAADDHTAVVSLLLLPAAPFTQGGRLRTFDRLAGHLYAQLEAQGAFDPASWPAPEPGEGTRAAGEAGGAPATDPAGARAPRDAPAPPGASDSSGASGHPGEVPHPAPAPDTADRLRRLEAAYGQGLLERHEYEEKRREILDAL